ncbi:hypothetical protein E8A74_20950 [Polyangium fumosum]|uniref:Uncharacterized protein n=2 Tax=Polyangium fumosum TaxID=889272 RepID=A0A4U1JC92_9BACT|nr:hypothetical protein E8A74_20950 [Polyangium fumosum]
MSRSLLGLPLAGLLAFSLLACESKDTAPVPAPEKVDEAKAKADAPKPEAKAEPKAEAEAKPEEAPKPEAEAKAEAPKDEPKADEKAKSEPKEEAKAAAPKGDTKPAADVAAKTSVPDAPNGILPKGVADKLVPTGGRPVVRLLVAGGEPRTAASYALVKGTSKPLRMGMALEMAMSAAGMNLPPTKMPRMVMTFDFSTGDKKGNDWPIEGTLKDVAVESQGAGQDKIAEALRPQLEPIKGLGMRYFVDEKGRVHDVTMSMPKAVPQAAQQMMTGMTQSIESMMAPLPDEPVGAGAKWEVLGRLTANGADLLQVSTFTLKERKGDVLTLDVAVKQLAAKDTVTPPGMPPGASARLVAFKSQGSGTSVLDTTDVAPTGGSMTVKSAMTLEVQISAGGKTEKQNTSVDTSVTVSYSRPGAK